MAQGIRKPDKAFVFAPTNECLGTFKPKVGEDLNLDLILGGERYLKDLDGVVPYTHIRFGYSFWTVIETDPFRIIEGKHRDPKLPPLPKKDQNLFWKLKYRFLCGFFGIMLIAICFGVGLVGYGLLSFLGSFLGESQVKSDVPKHRVIGVKETSEGGDFGLIGGGKKGPRGFMTPTRKQYEVTYEDENGVLRTKKMSSDPTK
tara:strand:+ start:61 stop:666 length:606 start_codon:yes stop_codon:yes gene_type:complete